MNTLSNSFLHKLGPGILFAGAAIGTSHLVQSTRAGAVYDLGLMVVVIFANLIKYPAFRFGPRYAAATGMSLIEAYARIGRWALAVVALLLFAIHIIIIAATAITTAGIGLAAAQLSFDARVAAAGFILLGLILLATGGYRLLDRLTKFFVIILTITTLVATLLAVPKIALTPAIFAFPNLDLATFAFVVALMGFMPSALDLSILHSCWSVAKQRDEGRKIDLEESTLDFNIGYVMSGFLAVCFLLLGAGVMHADNVQPASSAVEFAGQVISLYTSSLGGWAGFVVGISAFGVMFTTLITILDGFPRIYAATIQVLSADDARVSRPLDRSPLMTGIASLLSAGAIAILFFFMGQFTNFIDFVTITAFVIGPVIAIFNHIAMTSKDVPEAAKPSTLMRVWSWSAIVFLSVVTAAFLYTKFGT